MAIIFKPVLFFCVLISLFFSTSARTCTNYTFPNNQVFSSCKDLPVLNSFLHWNYNQSTELIVDIAYRHTNITSSRWVAWAINPFSSGMIGSQALVAFLGSDGIFRTYTSPVDSYSTQLLEGNLSFPVSNLSGQFANNEFIIFATLQLPINSTTVNQVWQEGPLIGNTPGIHPMSADNILSMGTLDFLS